MDVVQKQHEENLARDRFAAGEVGAGAAPVGAGAAAAGGPMNIMAGGFLVVVIIGPVIAAMLVGLVWGLLMKLKTVGRIIQTTIAGLFIGIAPFVGIVYFYKEILGIKTDIAPADIRMQYIIVCLIGWGISALIYFYLIHPVWARMGTWNFASLVKNCCMFPWFGYLIGGILMLVGQKTIGNIIGIGSIIGAAVYYLIKTIPHMKGIMELPKQPIAAIIAVALTCVLPAYSFKTNQISPELKQERIERDKEIHAAVDAAYTSIIEAAKNASTQRVTAKVLDNYIGTIIAEPKFPAVTVAKIELNAERQVTITGEVVTTQNSKKRTVYLVPIQYGNHKGYIGIDEIELSGN